MYDNICKFLAENYSQDFARWLLGQPIPLTQLSPSELSLEPIRADALILLESEQVILQIEFQTQPDPDIPFRLLDYRIRVYRRFPQKSMRQVVIYLKESGSEKVWQNTFTLPSTRHEFEVIRLWEVPTEALINTPGLLPLAVLSQTTERTETLETVAREIEKIENRRERSNVTAATGILAGLVLNKSLIAKVLREEIMRESVIYQEIVAEATAKGKAEGKAEGRREEGIALILRLLNRRLGEISPDLVEKIRQLSLEPLEDLGEALLDFDRESDLRDWLDAQDR